MPERSYTVSRITIDVEPKHTFITLDDTPVFDSGIPDEQPDFPDEKNTDAPPDDEYIGG